MTHLLKSKINTEECFQCQKCSAGCPIAPHMDYKPHQVIQMLALGMHDRLLACRTIWVCASCYTCSTRCPNDVDVAGVMDQLRQTALRQGVPSAEKDVPLFHRAFLDSIRFHGRVHELSMMAHYKIAAHKYLDDMKLGLRMFTKGKLRLLPSRIVDKNQIQPMFSKAVQPKGGR